MVDERKLNLSSGFCSELSLVNVTQMCHRIGLCHYCYEVVRMRYHVIFMLGCDWSSPMYLSFVKPA